MTITSPRAALLSGAGLIAAVLLGMTSPSVVRRLAGSILVALSLSFGALGCSDDNPAQPDDGNTCSHFDAEGLVIESGGETVYHQWEGTTSGEVEVGHEQTMEFEVVFLLPDSSRAVPDPKCEDQFMDVVVADETIAMATTEGTAGPWSFRVTGELEGETTLQVRILHIDHPDFTSLDIPVHVGEEHEVELEGFEIRSGDDVLVLQTEGVLTGELDVRPAEDSGPLTVTFFDGDGEEVAPEEGAELVFTVDDDAIASVTGSQTEAFEFTVNGLSEGETSFTFEVLHKGHADFTSLAIPVTVASGRVEAALLREGANPLSFWNYDPDRAPNQVQGGVVVEIGETRSVVVGWLGPYDETQVNDKRPELEVDSQTFDLAWTTTGGAAAIAAVPGQPMAVEVTGQAEGTSTVTFSLRRSGNPVLEAGPFPIEVVGASVNDGIQDHYLNFGGAWTVIVQDGEVVASGCGRDANPGQVVVDTGELSALYKITLLDEECTKTQLDSSYEYRFRFSDPGIARALQTPIHWGEDQVFHVEGLAAGTTDLSIYLFKDGEPLWKAPPYPVIVNQSFQE